MNDMVINTETITHDLKEHGETVKYLPGLIFFLLISVFLGLGIYHLTNPATLPIKQVRIEGEFQQLSPSYLEEIVNTVIKGGFFNVNVETIQIRLLDEPWVYHVSVNRVWPDAIAVYVEEQKAVARWGESGLINGNADLFFPAMITEETNLPVFYGTDNTRQLLVKKYFYLSELLNPLQLNIKTLSLDDRRAWKFTLVKGPTIVLGRKNVNRNIKRFTENAPAVLANNIEHIDSIDMRYSNGFAVRWKDDSLIIQNRQNSNG